MTLQEIDELKDQLFDTAQSLEEMIVYQEGRMPARMIEVQKANGVVDARRAVLNDNRAQLRRVKTYMLRAGVIKNKVVPQGDLANAPQGVYNSTVEKGQGMPPLPHPLPQPLPKRSIRDLVFAAVWFASFVAGFWAPVLHTFMATVTGITGLVLVLYWRIVDVRP